MFPYKCTHIDTYFYIQTKKLVLTLEFDMNSVSKSIPPEPGPEPPSNPSIHFEVNMKFSPIRSILLIIPAGMMMFR